MEPVDNTPLIGLIPAAGKGVRARPYTHEIHKGMLNIHGMPNLERIIAIMRDEMAIKTVVIVVGYLGESIKTYFGDGEGFGVDIKYVDNNDLDRGWAWSVLLARQYIASRFCVMLCDECYISSNHADLGRIPDTGQLAICAGMHVDDARMIKKNYGIVKDGNTILQLIEKPQSITNDLMGSGTFLFGPQIFDMIEAAFNEQSSVDLVSLLNDSIATGHQVEFFELSGSYVNINDRDSIHLAKYYARISHFDQYSASLLICSEGDEGEIAFTIDRYRELGIFEQIVVIMPHDNAIAETCEGCDVEVVVCPEHLTLYGERVRYGLSRLRGDIFVMTEADYSFPNRDIEKLFSYLKEADMVVGTRTTRQLIEQGSTMTGLVRLAHAGLGRLMELLWWNKEGRFTDLGCTCRALWSSTFRQIEPTLVGSGPEFLAEMVIASLDQRLRVLEIPINYYNRSKSQNRSYRNVATFLRLLGFLFRRRIQSAPTPEPGGD